MNILSKLKNWFIEIKEWVIWHTIERNMKLSEETKRNIQEGLEDIKMGRTYTLEEVKKELKI